MKESWGAKQAGRALLFERLVKDPDQWFGEPTRSLPEPRRTHDREGLRASVLREIRSALTTRCAIPSGEALALARTPMGRFGETGDLAGAAIYLASAASSYVTGETIRVDGGFLAAGL